MNKEEENGGNVEKKRAGKAGVERGGGWGIKEVRSGETDWMEAPQSLHPGGKLSSKQKAITSLQGRHKEQNNKHSNQAALCLPACLPCLRARVGACQRAHARAPRAVCARAHEFMYGNH